MTQLFTAITLQAAIQSCEISKSDFTAILRHLALTDKQRGHNQKAALRVIASVFGGS